MRIRAVILSVASFAFAGGCAPEPGQGTGGVPAMDDSMSRMGARVTARWPFWPVRMRIHPLTMARSDLKTGEPLIDARIEFFDSYGHTAKGLAQFRFELHDHDPGESAATPIQEWNVDLREPDLNAVHYDIVTDTYLFRLLLNAPIAGGTWFLRVHVLSIDGQTFVQTVQL